MRDLNKAMKKLQEAKRLESTKLAKLVKESVVEPEDKEETFDNKFNYKVSLDNGKTITATCSKENIEDARKYFLGKSYLNTKTGEKAKIVGVEEINSDENGFEEIKNEEFGSTSKQLTDNDPAQKVPFDSDAKKDIEKAATQKPKIVAEEFGSENKDLTDNDPAQKKAFETETRKKMDDATKGKTIDDKIDESKKLNEATEEDINNENKLEKAKQLIEVIFNMDSLDETRRAAKQELKDLVYPQRIEPEKTEKKIVKESIFDNDEETKVKEDRLADLRTQLEVDGEQLADDEKESIQAEIDSLENDLYESLKPENDNGDYKYFYSPQQIIEICEDRKYEHAFDEESGTIEELEKELQDIKRIESEKPITTIEEPLTDRYPGWKNCKVKTILKDGREFVSEEDTLSVWSAVQLVVADEVMKESCKPLSEEAEKEEFSKNDKNKSKQLKEDWDDDEDEDEDNEEYELIACNKDNDTLKSLSACIGDYEASMTGITGCPEYQELVKYAENNKEVDKIYIDYPDREYVIWTRVFGDYPEFDSLEEADEAEDEEGYDNLDESKRLKENIANDGRTKGKTLEVIYTDKDGKEKTTHFECDKEYELDGEQIREAIKSSDNDIVDIIKINESKCLTEDEDEESEERAIDANSEVVNKKISRMNVHKDVVSILGNGAIKLADKYNIQMNTILDNVEDTIVENSNLFESCENEGIQEPLNEEGCDDCSIENVDDETFTEAFTKFIKENYKNAKEFKLENVFKSGNNYRFECKLTFNSGKEVKVDLMSEATIKEGKSLIRFYENKTFKHLDENKSIMTVTVKLENKTLSCEGLRYNYRVALKENKIATIKGIIK